jgi:hypothetical protein
MLQVAMSNAFIDHPPTQASPQTKQLGKLIGFIEGLSNEVVELLTFYPLHFQDWKPLAADANTLIDISKRDDEWR